MWHTLPNTNTHTNKAYADNQGLIHIQENTRLCSFFYCATLEITKITPLMFYLLQKAEEAQKESCLLLWLLWGAIQEAYFFLQVTFKWFLMSHYLCVSLQQVCTDIYSYHIVRHFCFLLSMLLDSKLDCKQIKMGSCRSWCPKQLVRICCQSLPTHCEV